MKKKLIVLSDELWQAIDDARGHAPRNPWIESQLWRLKAIKAGAESTGVQKPERPSDGRGLHRTES